MAARPPYLGPSGWVGVMLDERTDWAMVAELVDDAWRLIAPKRLLASASGSTEPR